MPISEGTSLELDAIIAEIDHVCKNISTKRDQLDKVINLDPMVSERLSSKGRSSRSRRSKPVPAEDPGQNPLQLERIRLLKEIEHLSFKEMELGKRKRELEREHDARK